MRKLRLSALLLALVMLLCILPVSAAESSSWLVPKVKGFPGFADVKGTWCESYVETVYQAGLMEGKSTAKFDAASPLTGAQIIVISARLHRLLTGGTLDYFEPISLKGADWWTPYDGYLREQLSALAEDTVYAIIRETPTDACCRSEFFHLLSAVVKAAGTSLPERNAVYAVPDCCDQDILQFYRWGVLGGKDQYGTLRGGDALSRGAAAAMLARLIDPAQRLTLELEPLELCRELLEVDPDTVLMTVSGREVTAGEFMPTLVATESSYNHSHFGSMMLEQSGRTPLDEAVDAVCRLVLCESLAEELGLEVPPSNTVYFSGYQGLTAHGQEWQQYHERLLQAVLDRLGEGGIPAERLPQPEFAEIWDTLPFSGLSYRVAALPYWAAPSKSLLFNTTSNDFLTGKERIHYDAESYPYLRGAAAL